MAPVALMAAETDTAKLSQMARMESLNSFFVERLMSVAGEIFEAVKDTVSEYQEEIKRTKQENRRLRQKLTELSVSISCEKQTPGAGHADSPEQQNFPQTSLHSETSVIHLKLELASVKQEAEPQRLTAGVCGKTIHDTQPSHADGRLLVHQNSSLELQDSDASLTEVNLELTPTEEGKVHQEDLGTKFLLDVMDVERNPDDHLQAKSFITARLESCKQLVIHDNTTSSAPQIQSVQGNYADTLFYAGTTCSQNLSANNSFTCERCGKLCRSAWFLKEHLVTYHMEKPYVCDLCGKCCSHEQLLKAHLKTHRAERPFQCSVCGKAYKMKHHLKDHVRTHTGDKRYSCSVCGMGFVWINQVKVHIQNHHRGQTATVLKK